MHTRTLALLVCVPELVGCVAEVDDHAAHTEALARPVDTRAVPLDPSSDCDRTRLIGTLDYGFTCPTAHGDWVGTPLFRTPTGDPRIERRYAPFVVSPEGTGFCLYEHNGERFSRDGLPWDRSATGGDDVGGRPPEIWLDEDCAVVAALDGDDEPFLSVVDAYETAYRAQMDGLDTLPALTSPVEVALIDSSPNSASAEIEPTFDLDQIHGRAVGMAIRSIGCPEGRSGTCVPLFHSWRALQTDRRAYVGALAQVVERAVRGRRPDVDGRLILNLSLGFHPEFAREPSDDDVAEYREHTRAILAALNFATCHDAIPIVAAGNTEEGPDPDGRPMYPAAFAETSAWTCTSSPVELDVPVVHAASGVDPFDRDLPNAREDARASLAAPAFSVAVADPVAGPLPPMTGSSFGAAGVTAVAALVWSYLPDATASEVMALVHDTAVDIELDGAFCFPVEGACPHTRRVSVCRAVSRVLRDRCIDGDAAACAALPTLPACTLYPNAAIDLPANALDPFVEENLAPAFTIAPPPVECSFDSSHTVHLAAVPNNAENVCPDAVLQNGLFTATNGPQPGDVPCRVCALLGAPFAQARVIMQLEPNWQGMISSAVVNIGQAHFAISGPALAVAFQSVLELTLPYPTNAINPQTVASISFQMGNQVTVVPIPIW
jgi:hypothetical protein